MSVTSIIITTVDTAAMVLDQLHPQIGASALDSVDRIARYVDGIANGAFYFSSIQENIGATQAHATITSTGTATNGETMSLANVTLTAETSGADPTLGQFNISGTVAIQAASIALAINSTPALLDIVTATSALGIVTVTAVNPGLVGNGIQISEALTNVTVAQFSGGLNGTLATLA